MTKEQDRLLIMLNENKITEDEFKILSASLEKKPSFIEKVFYILINPFRRIAGLHALIAGLLIMVMISYLGTIAKVYFPGVIDCLNASVIKNPKVPLSFFVLLSQNLLSWIVLSTVFMISAKFFEQKRIRAIDFFGTVALSRFPFLILVIFLSIVRVINPAFMEIDLSKGIQIQNSLMTPLFGTVVIMCFIWQLITYFHALKESSGLNGKSLWISFIGSIILSEIIAVSLTVFFL